MIIHPSRGTLSGSVVSTDPIWMDGRKGVGGSLFLSRDSSIDVCESGRTDIALHCIHAGVLFSIENCASSVLRGGEKAATGGFSPRARSLARLCFHLNREKNVVRKYVRTYVRTLPRVSETARRSTRRSVWTTTTTTTLRRSNAGGGSFTSSRFDRKRRR